MSQTKDGKQPPQAHKDIAVWPGERGQAAVILSHSSPFAACSLSTTPGPLGRDISPNIPGLLTGLAGFGATLSGPLAAAHNAAADQNFKPENLPHLSAEGIATEEQKISDHLEAYVNDSSWAYTPIQAALKAAATIKANLSYSYAEEDEARNALKAIYVSESDLQEQKVPDSTKVLALQQQLEGIESDVSKLEAQGGDEVKAWVSDFRENKLPAATKHIGSLPAAIVWLTDAKAAGAKLIDFLATLSNTGTAGDFPTGNTYITQILPIAIYPESKVAVTIKCTDAVTSAPLFDSIQFNAFYQVRPTFDISAGVLVSFLKGRQVGVQADPYPATTSTLAVTSHSRVQFIPGTFVEYHPFDFKLWWVHDPAFGGDSATWMSMKAPRHVLGYVGSFGLAGGFLVNPNNGTGEAEFFEGVSLGVQRFAILIGNHTGRSQNFIEGYAVGDPVTSTVAPPTTRNWGNGVAIGIAYRIPLR